MTTIQPTLLAMSSIGSAQVRQAVAAGAAALRVQLDGPWGRLVPEMDWTVAHTVAHVAGGLLWYATDLWSGPEELTTMSLSVREDADPADLIRTVESFGAVMAAAVEAAGPDRLGWHPAGRPDRTGFAAMACDEVLIHTSDALRGLDAGFEPDHGLCQAVVARLFPDAPEGFGGWETLLWANGRVALPGHPRQTRWRWHCAPLEG
ncbi:MAG TPA: maleylpyruvate isomerase N-terminal domain-containing protein [Candidatus Dormibacteraeota bacterium]|jgi:hypothetical protein|nr:maleylpyruvate isomerase N-terminal domain-containing protein [Candidatus Dormibacteraeota bacterium]